MTIRLARIDLFPIKSFDSVSVDSARVLASGALQNDRRFAIYDAAGRVVNGKRTPLVHTLRMEFGIGLDQVVISDATSDRQDEFSLAADRAALENRLSEHFGFLVALRENVEAGFPDDTLSPGPTVITSETLSAVASWFSISDDEARRRFRANLIIEGGGPFWEDRLFAPPGETVTFRIGDVMLFGTNPCARCVVPSRDSGTGEQVRGFAKLFAAQRRQSLPPWVATETFDHFYRLAVNTRLFAPAGGGVLRVGDPVEILD